ncbi:MAG: calcium-binding protein, partial [Microvirga sp.]
STVSDLGGTDVTQANVDLGVNGGGDGQPDSVIVNGSAAADAVKAAGGGGSVNVTGLAATVAVTHAEPTRDALT